MKKWTRKQCIAFYATTEWRKKRRQIRERDHNECVWCRRKGKAVFKGSRDDRGKKVRLFVHHIKHLEDFPEYRLEDWNLVTLCGDCHNEAHPEKAKTVVEINEKNRQSNLPEELRERW